MQAQALPFQYLSSSLEAKRRGGEKEGCWYRSEQKESIGVPAGIGNTNVLNVYPSTSNHSLSFVSKEKGG